MVPSCGSIWACPAKLLLERFYALGYNHQRRGEKVGCTVFIEILVEIGESELATLWSQVEKL